MEYKKILIIVAAVAVVFVVVWWLVSRREPEAPMAIDKSKTVIAFGDSLVVGQGALADQNFVDLLSKRLEMPIINAGVGGDTTVSGLARLEEDVISKHPDVVVVLLGGNDALRRMPEDQTFANLNVIVTKIQASGAKVLLLGIRGGLLGDSYKKNFEQLARNKNVPYVPDVLGGLFSNSEYMHDSIHPNAKGYAKIADRVEPELRKLLR